MHNNKMECFPVVFSKVSKAIRKRHMVVLKPYGLSSIHAMYLTTLLHEENGLTFRELNERLFVNKANTSRVITTLEEKGYIKRKCETNIAKPHFVLTKEGKKVAHVLAKDVKYTHDKLVEDLTEDEIKTVREVMYKISKAAEKI